ncbi:glycosyl hydrolase [Boeremia exigua]|uniref:glycosyl hydrolase n=1 Tax=Boeremia exigua TaxID=749465 RepID=UPI001E8D37F0|nr:glycosyl hydrolase [Boeremia exigua]KAH6618882.1 glycosyl hydrolase [Boeremia exigua]
MNYILSLSVAYLLLNTAYADYARDAESAIKLLQDKWYNAETGLWSDMWWQSGNIVETIARFGIQDADFKQAAIDIVSNTYDKSPNQKGYNNWKNDFYDDEGWWAMGWIASFDLTGDQKYLNTAKDLFEDMTGGWTTPCKGGIWWNKPKTSIASISNELFLAVGASLANRVSAEEKSHYQDWAQMEWDWFWNSGVIRDGLINDGVDNITCQNDGKTTFTYNQGVVLTGLSELAKAKSDGGLIAHANELASTSMSRLSDNGILTEPVNHPLDEQGAMFKGPYVRGLSTLNENEGQQTFTDFLKKNADSALANAKNGDGVIRDRWQGGSDGSGAASHAAGIDVLVAALQAST